MLYKLIILLSLDSQHQCVGTPQNSLHSAAPVFFRSHSIEVFLFRAGVQISPWKEQQQRTKQKSLHPGHHFFQLVELQHLPTAGRWSLCTKYGSMLGRVPPSCRSYIAHFPRLHLPALMNSKYKIYEENTHVPVNIEAKNEILATEQ